VAGQLCYRNYGLVSRCLLECQVWLAWFRPAIHLDLLWCLHLDLLWCLRRSRLLRLSLRLHLSHQLHLLRRLRQSHLLWLRQ